MSCGLGHRHGSDPTLLWLWCRLGATAQIRPGAWEPPCAVGAALKGQKTKKKKKKRKKKNIRESRIKRLDTKLLVLVFKNINIMKNKDFIIPIKGTY